MDRIQQVISLDNQILQLFEILHFYSPNMKHKCRLKFLNNKVNFLIQRESIRNKQFSIELILFFNQ